MIRKIIMLVAATALLLLVTGAKEKEQQQSKLESGFLNPPPDARPHTFWIWMNGNVTREGITADLESMARVGIGGVLLFNVAGSHGTDIPAGPVDYLSDEWLDLLKYTASEADRLGIEMGLHNCAGWATTGGPWIKPEDGMQQLVSAEMTLWGNRLVVQRLPHPEVFEGFYRDIGDEQFPDDCEWVEGKYLKRWPDWFLNKKQRPEPSRITFTTWKHWNTDDNLIPSGLVGPVTLRCSKLIPLMY